MTETQPAGRARTARSAASGAAQAPPAPHALDALDYQLLGALSIDARLTNKALAARLGVAESTCAYRVRALRENGVIQDTRVRLNARALGCPIQAIIKVRLGSHNRAEVNQLFDDLVAVPGVIQCFHVAGADDFHLHVAVQDAEALRDIVLLHVTTHRVVRQTETQLIFELRDGPGFLAHHVEPGQGRPEGH